MKVDVLNTADRRARADIERLVRRVSRDFPMPRTTLNVVLVCDRRMREMNRRFLGRDRPTDVLAFPSGTTDPQTRTRLLGEVYVARGRARAQGRDYATGYYGELRRLVLHGILHLLGLDHEAMEHHYSTYL